MTSSVLPEFGAPKSSELVNAARGIAILGVTKAGPNVISNARATLLGSIDSCHRTILDLKVALNALTPIGQLPQEILGHIMVWVSRMYYEDEGALAHSVQWIQLAHVCSSWRLVALSTPLFWANLSHPRKNMLPELLSKSKQAPLSIKMYLERNMSINYPRTSSILDTLVQHFPRMRELQLHGRHEEMKKFCQKLQLPANHLYKLALSADHDRSSTATSLMPVLGTRLDPLPRLRHLELQNLFVPWRDPIFASPLTTLIIRSFIVRSATPVTGTFDELLTVLEPLAPYLTVLHLMYVIPSLPTITANVPNPARVVTFPCLREVNIAGNTNDCANLFGCISLPCVPRVLKLNLSGNIGIDKITTHLVDLFTRPEGPVLLSADITSNARSLLVTAHGGFDLEIDTEPSIEVNININVPNGSALPFNSVFLHDGNFCGSLKEVVISGECPQMEWTTVFARLPELRRLGLLYVTPTGNFGEALRYAKGSPTGPLPMLRTLALEHVRFRDAPPLPVYTAAGGSRGRGRANAQRDNRNEKKAFCNFLRDALKTRVDAGVQLAQLLIDGCIRVRKTDIEALKKVVAEVRWDGIDRRDSETEDETESDEYYHYHHLEEDPYYDSDDLIDSEDGYTNQALWW